MLSDQEKRLLHKELVKTLEINKRAEGILLPEEKKLIETEYPSGGLHVHDVDNPLGMHRHLLGDTIDGAHVHSPQNPKGEHVHGEFEGMALIDGEHYHDDSYGDGYHRHKSDDDENSGQIIPQVPKLSLS